jgi:hypothetical protein
MEPLEFLGGKYQQPEQIVPGDVQTFRAQEAETGRTVFVHRVSTTSGDPQQAALLRLVLLGVFRSPTARNQMLDFGEEPGFCYVVTESAPKCLLLREWLQFELDSAASGRAGDRPKPAASSNDVVDADQKFPVNRPAPDEKEAKTGGDNKAGPQVLRSGAVPFVIREQPVKPTAASPAAPNLTAPPRVEPVRKDPTPVEPTSPQPTWEFGPEAAKVDAKPEPRPEPVRPKVEPVAPPPSHEPGEFTRFFKGGLPPAAPGRPDAFRSQDRPSHGHGPVQRPSNSPSNPGGKTEPGEFTRIFMKSAGEQPPPVAPAPISRPEFNAPSRTGFPDSGKFGSNNAFESPRVERLPDLSNRPSDLPSMFQMNAEAPTPMRSAAQEPGEYTRMFGKGGAAPPPQAPSAVGPLPSFRTDDPLGGTNFGMPSAPTPVAPPPPSGPSEFTRVMMGNRPQEPGAGQGAAGMAAPPAGGAPAGMGAPPAMGKPPAMPAQFPGMGGGAPAAPAGGHPMGTPGPAGHGGEGMGGAPMGGNMGGVRVTPMNPMYGMGAMGGMGGGMGQMSTNLGGMGSAGASMGNPMLGQAGHMGVMTPMGQMQVGGGSMQPMGQPGAPAGHPGAAGHNAGGHPAMPGKFPGALPKAPTTGLGAKGKLLILFAVLGVLAVAMVLFVIFSGHK